MREAISAMKKPRFFIDFDGTISTADVIDLILDRFADEKWKAVEKEWADGTIGSRECLSRQLELVSASPAEWNALVDTVSVDPGFIPFLRRTRELGIPVAIVSDGLDVVIERVLKNALGSSMELLEDLPIYSNRLQWAASKPRFSFYSADACKHRCANCKEAVIGAVRNGEDMTVFIGDGLSDRFAAGASDLTFAKGKLLAFCEKNNIPHRAWSGFHEIERWLTGRMAVVES